MVASVVRLHRVGCGAVDTKGSGPDITPVASLGPAFLRTWRASFVGSARVSAGYESQHLATNPRNIRYHTLRYRGVYAQRTPLYALSADVVDGVCYREFPRMLALGNSVNRGNPLPVGQAQIPSPLFSSNNANRYNAASAKGDF